MKGLKHLFFILTAGLLALALLSPNVYAKEKKVMIGFTGPLSGPAAQYGRDNVAGLEMAIQDINAAGGITVGSEKYTFELKTYDDHIDPTAAVNNARRLRSRDGAKFIFNPVFNTLAPMMQVNQQRGSEFMLMAYTSTPKVDEAHNPNVIAIPPPFSVYLGAYLEYAKSMGWKKGAMVVTLGAYGDEWRKSFKEAWIKEGGVITADKPANYYTETDFSAQLSAAIATGPEFMLIGGPSATTGLVIEQARNLGFKGGFIMVDQAKLNYIADVSFNGDKSKLNGVMGVARVLDIAPKPIMQKFIDRYKKDYGRIATSENTLNYAMMSILAAAMEKAGTVDDLQAIKGAINDVTPLPPEKGLLAYVGIQETRMVIPGSVQMVKDGEYTNPIETFWWTKDEAEYQRVITTIPDLGHIRKLIPLEGYAK